MWGNGARAAKAGCIVVWGKFAQIGGIFKYRPQPGPIIIRTGRTMSKDQFRLDGVESRVQDGHCNDQVPVLEVGDEVLQTE